MPLQWRKLTTNPGWQSVVMISISGLITKLCALLKMLKSLRLKISSYYEHTSKSCQLVNFLTDSIIQWVYLKDFLLFSKRETTLVTSCLLPWTKNPSNMGQLFIPLTLRKAKIVCNFGLSECNMVTKTNCS